MKLNIWACYKAEVCVRVISAGMTSEIYSPTYHWLASIKIFMECSVRLWGSGFC
jgi:hypothetical protein